MLKINKRDKKFLPNPLFHFLILSFIELFFNLTLRDTLDHFGSPTLQSSQSIFINDPLISNIAPPLYNQPSIMIGLGKS